MSIELLVILGLLAIVLIIGLFSMMTNPREIDAEEEEGVVQKERRWWRRK